MWQLGVCDNLGFYLVSTETESEYLSDYCHYKTPVSAKNNLDKLIKFLDKNNYNCYTGLVIANCTKLIGFYSSRKQSTTGILTNEISTWNINLDLKIES